MFSDLDRSRHPLATRGPGIFLGSLVLVAIVAALVAPRSQAFTIAVVVVGFLATALVRRQVQWSVSRFSSGALPLLGFLAFALASAAWAVEPWSTFMMTGAAALVALGTIASLRCLANESRPNLAHIGEGVWLGYLIGLVYLLIEICTSQVIKATIYNAIGLNADDLSHPEYFTWAAGHLVSISAEELTRNIAPATLFLWPSVFVARGALRSSWGTIVSLLMVLLSGVVIYSSWHGTSKVAFLAGAAIFICARMRPRLTHRLLSAVWIVACLAIVPLALLAHRLDLHNATWLEDSARHRIIIWNFTAQEVFDSPVLGIGARSTYTLGPRLEKSIENLPDEEFRRTLSKHSHNIFLQTWLELGLVGAVLLTMAGLSILRVISALEVAAQPYGFAAFATAAAMAASSYGMWQAWFVAMFGLGALLFGVGVQLSARRGSVARTAQCD